MSQACNAQPINSPLSEVSSIKGRKHNRSRKGCWTCRSSKVKCDETSPTCKRCSRLHLTCTWAQNQVSLKQRRRGLGSIKSRDNWTPPPIRAEFQGGNQSVHGEASDGTPSPDPSTYLNSVTPGCSQTTDLESITGIWETNLQSDKSCQPLSGTPISEIFELDSEFQQSLSEGDQTSNFAPEPDGAASSNLFEYFDALPTTPLGPPALSTYHIPLPNSLTLSRVEHSAVDYYSRTFSILMTTKEPSWSTNAILLQVGTHNPMVMHLLLSSMFSEMAFNQPRADLLVRAAQQHYRTGVQGLVELLSSSEEPNHVAVMSAFWFLYVCSRRRKEMTFQTVSQLSVAVRNHIEMFGLHKLIAASKSPSDKAITHGKPLSPKEQSLLARLIIWTYYSDVQYSFRGCRGALANFLHSQPNLSDEIYDRSRSVLELNWGTSYPITQAIDDMENSAPLDLLYKMWKTVQIVNEASHTNQLPEMWAPAIEEQLSKMETEYSTVFRLAKTPVTPRNRLLCNVDWVVSHFYALRIYYFHCSTTLPLSTPSPTIVQDAVKSLLSIAQRTLTHGVTDQNDRMQWPLFLAGIETDDPIHREWILSKMPVKSQLRATLEAIMRTQEDNGGVRVTAQAMREMLSCASAAGALGSGTGVDDGVDGWGEAQIACMF